MSQVSALKHDRGGPKSSDLQLFSCLLCRQRKIRCDRRSPCSNCVRTARECNYTPPVRGKRPKKIAPKEGLHAKIRRYEEMLKSYGADIEPSEFGTPDTVSEHDVQMEDSSPGKSDDSSHVSEENKPKLISKNGSSRYFECGYWPGLKDEQHPVDEISSGNLDALGLQASDDGMLHESAFVLRSAYQSLDLTSLHFSLPILQKLFGVFRERIDPLWKLLHLPTFWSDMINSLEHPQDMSDSLAALIFSFYFTTIVSLDEDECYSLLGEKKFVVKARYELAARQVLMTANFLVSQSLMTLQAFSTFLMGMRSQDQRNSLHVLSGIAVRLARRMGLHRDGTFLGLSPFETEIRRRLWWHITQVDWRTSELSGTRASLDLFLSDTKKPLNIEDEDISPDTIDPPPERASITSVMLCLLRCHNMDALRQLALSSKDYQWTNITGPSIPLAEKEALIARLEEMLETTYLRYQDPSNTFHVFSAILSRSSISRMKLIAHDPRQFVNSGVPESSRDILFQNAIKQLSYAALIYSDQGLRKFAWQLSTGFICDPIHYVLVEVCRRKTGSDVDRAWQLMGTVFSNYPQMFERVTDHLYIALGNWTLQAWDKLATASKTEGLPESPTPDFITSIRQCRRPLAQGFPVPNEADLVEKVDRNSTHPDEVEDLSILGDTALDSELFESYEFSNLLSFDLEPDEWTQWERLLSGQSF